MLPFPKFENNILSDQSILKNSQEIQHKKMVKQIQPISDNEWIATIQSQTLPDQSYQVLVRINDGYVSYMTCNCPYDCGALCKHIGATLLEIKKKKLHTKQKRKQMIDLENPEGIKVSFLDEANDKKDENIQKEIVRMTNYVPNKENQDINLIDQELECNVCLNIIENPVLLPCQAHTMCFDCFSRLYARRTVQKGGYRHVQCPVCSDNGGKFTIRNLESMKICKKLEKICRAYETEKNKTTLRFDKLIREQEKEKDLFDDFVKNYDNKSKDLLKEKNELEKTVLELSKTETERKKNRKSAGIQAEIEIERNINKEQQAFITINSEDQDASSEFGSKIPELGLNSYDKNYFDTSMDEKLIPASPEELMSEMRSSNLSNISKIESKRPSKLEENESRRKSGSIKSKLSLEEKLEIYGDKIIQKSPEFRKSNESLFSPKTANEVFKDLIGDSIPASQESVLEKRENPYKFSEILIENQETNFTVEHKENIGCLRKGLKKVKTATGYFYRSAVPAMMELFIVACIYALLFRLGLEFLFPIQLSHNMI